MTLPNHVRIRLQRAEKAAFDQTLWARLNYVDTLPEGQRISTAYARKLGRKAMYFSRLARKLEARGWNCYGTAAAERAFAAGDNFPLQVRACEDGFYNAGKAANAFRAWKEAGGKPPTRVVPTRRHSFA